MTLVEMSGIIEASLWDFSPRPVIDGREFRHALSHFPSGVAVITGTDEHGAPVGMTCQSFSSLSLDPALVLIAPSKGSRSWPRIVSGGRFAVNILGEGHEALSGAFARSGSDKFADVAWHFSPEGLPLLGDAIAQIECEISNVHDGGDHWIVVGAVNALQTHRTGEEEPRPLVFYRSSYRRLLDEVRG